MYLPQPGTIAPSKALPNDTSSSSPLPLPFVAPKLDSARILASIRDRKLHRRVYDFDDHLEDSYVV